uniref:Uncharacterized protein n=1 Tax=Leersia perrieri TaxID=77586 RepID=A0A0D9WDV2_9ORYZ
MNAPLRIRNFLVRVHHCMYIYVRTHTRGCTSSSIEKKKHRRTNQLQACLVRTTLMTMPLDLRLAFLFSPLLQASSRHSSLCSFALLATANLVLKITSTCTGEELSAATNVGSMEWELAIDLEPFRQFRRLNIYIPT